MGPYEVWDRARSQLHARHMSNLLYALFTPFLKSPWNVQLMDGWVTNWATETIISLIPIYSPLLPESRLWSARGPHSEAGCHPVAWALIGALWRNWNESPILLGWVLEIPQESSSDRNPTLKNMIPITNPVPFGQASHFKGIQTKGMEMLQGYSCWANRWNLFPGRQNVMRNTWLTAFINQ